MSESDKKKVTRECEECIKWLDKNQLADKEEFEHKLKEVTKICSPIMTKLHKGSSGHGSGERGSKGGNGPTIEEVD